MHLTLTQALILGLLQGVAELFPISSLAQTILIPALLGWNLNQKDSDFLAFVVALHLATAIALVIYFWKDWRKVIAGFFGCLTHGKLVYDRDSKFAWLLVAGTVVVGAVGLAAEKKLRTFFEDPKMTWVVAAILVVNGFVMLFGDFMKRRASAPPMADPEHAPDLAMHAALVGAPISRGTAPEGYVGGKYSKNAEDLSFTQATLVGAAQTFALLPGISRSGVTMVSGLFAGLSYEQSSRFTFMLATPVIALAAILKVPSLLHSQTPGLLKLSIYGSIAAGIAAYLSIRFLMRYFHTNRLWPFGVFCLVFGLASAVYLKAHPEQDLTQKPGQNASVDGSGQVVAKNAPTGR
jgi:undecaprenyl-diphosphatase